MADVTPADLVGEDKKAAKGPKQLPAARKGKGERLNDEDFQSLVFEWASDAENYSAENLAVQRSTATEYYRGKLPDVDTQTDADEDRSTAVLSEVRDTVLGIMPDLLRIFFSADGVVRYLPVACDDPDEYAKRCAMARDATAYVQNVVLRVDNPDSFLDFHSAFQDALVRKTGLITWRWETSKKPIYSTHTGLSEDLVVALAAADGVEIVGKRIYPSTDTALPGQPATLLYDVQIRRTVEAGRARIYAVPCENVRIARKGSSLARTTLFGWVEDKKVGDFLAEGWIDDASELDDCDRDPNDTESLEAAARRPETVSATGPADDPPQDPTQRDVKYGELYLTADRDGDGIAELIRVITAGTQYKILDEEKVEDVPAAAFCPYPEAHQFFGDSIADLTMDIQRIKSRILRDTLDSLAQSVVPQLGVVSGKVNLDDVLSPDVSKIIRQDAPGMVEAITTPFVGKEALPVLELLDKVRENRTGQSDASNGLDPAVLQSSTQSAVHATLTKAQSRVEMIARIFAETGMTRLFRGLLKLICQHQDMPRMVELNGRPVRIDPSQWSAEMSVEVTLALGRGSQQDQLGFLAQVAAKQEQILLQLGPDNPICTMDQLAYTYCKMVEIAGWRNTSSFFLDPSTMSPEQKQALTQAMQQHMAAAAQAKSGGAKGPDPQVEAAKIKSHQQIEAGKRQIDMAKLKLQLHDAHLRAQTSIQTALITALVGRMTDLDTAKIDALVGHASDRLAAHTNAAIAAMEHASDERMNDANNESAERQAAMAAQQVAETPSDGA